MAASFFVCPDCGGTLWEVNDGDLAHFRCHIGHSYTIQSLMAEQIEALEEALWVALRSLEESEALARRMAERAHSRGHHRAAEQFEAQAQNAHERVKIVRDVLLNGVLGDKSAVADTDEEVAQAQHEEGKDAPDTP